MGAHKRDTDYTLNPLRMSSAGQAGEDAVDLRTVLAPC